MMMSSFGHSHPGESVIGPEVDAEEHQDHAQLGEGQQPRPHPTALQPEHCQEVQLQGAGKEVELE